MKHRDIKTASDLKRYGLELKSAYTLGRDEIKLTVQKSFKELLPWNIAIKFAEGKMNNRLDRVFDIKGRFIANVSASILNKTLFRKAGFFYRVVLSFGAKQAVKYLVKSKLEKPVNYKPLLMARNNNVIQVIQKPSV